MSQETCTQLDTCAVTVDDVGLIQNTSQVRVAAGGVKDVDVGIQHHPVLTSLGSPDCLLNQIGHGKGIYVYA